MRADLPCGCARLGPETALRLALATVLLLVVPRIPPWSVLLGAMVLAGWSGAGYHARLQGAAYHQAEPLWAFMERPLWQGPLVVRATGWAVPRAHACVRFPAVLLAVGKGRGAGGCPSPCPGQEILLTTSEEPPLPGQTVAMVAKLWPPGRAAMPGGFADGRYLAGKGISWRGSSSTGQSNEFRVTGPTPWLLLMLARFHEILQHRIKALFPPPEAALTTAVLLGIRSPLAVQGARPFARLGLAHLFALSGLHVGILLGMILLIPEAVGWGPGGKLLPVLLVLPLYVLLTGAPGSVIRATGMVGLGMAAPWLGRRGDSVRLLGLLFLLVLWWGPRQMLDTGTRLSFFAAGGILAAGRASGGFRIKGRAPLRMLVAGLGVSLAAQWFTLPEVTAGFGYLNLLSPLFNLLAVPLFGLVVWLTVLSLACSWWGWLSESLAALAILGWRGMLQASVPLVRMSSGSSRGLMPPGLHLWTLWLVVTGIMLALITALRGRRSRRGIGVALLVLLAWGTVLLLAHAGRTLYPRGAPVAWQVDVGQGDCAILAFPDCWRCVIDTGGVWGTRGQGGTMWERTLGPYLARQNIRALDLVVLTHGHLDHTGGAGALARQCAVGSWLCGGHAAPPGEKPPAARVRCGILHAWRGWTLELTQAPDPDDARLSENDHSLMLMLKRNGRTVMVWGGDQETESEGIFLTSHPGCGPAQTWKAGHHGSATSGSAAFLAVLHPGLCLVSCGSGNRYHHPSHGPYVIGADTLAVARTDCAGSILLRWGFKGNLRWSTMYGPGGRVPAP